MRFCLRAQVKIAWSFYQVATLIPVVYLVQLPTQVEEALDIFRISIELEAYNIHISCYGASGIDGQIGFLVIWPIIGICATPLIGLTLSLIFKQTTLRELCAFRNGRGDRSFIDTVLLGYAMPLTMLILYFAFPQVTALAFRLFEDCTTFTDELGESRAFLISDRKHYAVPCPSDELKGAQSTAWAAIFLYPVGVILLSAWLLYCCRSTLLLEQESTPYTRSISFLHAPFKPTYFYFDLLELAKKLFLIGFASLIEPGTLAQITVAVLASQLFLVLHLQSLPYRRNMDNILATMVNLSLVFFFFWTALLQTGALGGDDDLEPDRLSSMGNAVSLMMLIAVVGVLVVAALLFFFETAAKASKERVEKRQREKWAGCTIEPPTVKWPADKGYACFLSHYKMEAASDARLLHNMLTKMLRYPVFLDSAKLTDLRKLIINGVADCDVMLVLGTKGVFTRPWCLLEIVHSARLNVPIIIIDIKNGGFDASASQSFVDDLEEKMSYDDPSGLELLHEHMGSDLTELKLACTAAIRTFTGKKQLSWNPNASDSELVACLKDIVDEMAAAVGSTLEWKGDVHSTHSVKQHKSVAHSTRPALHLVCNVNEALNEARVLQTELAMRLDRLVSTSVPSSTGGLDMIAHDTEAMVVLLTKQVLHEPAALMEVYDAVQQAKPIVPICIFGRGYNFKEAQVHLSELETRMDPQKLAKLRMGLEMLSSGAPDNKPVSIGELQAALLATLPRIIAVNWEPQGGKHQLDAAVTNVLGRLHAQQAEAPALKKTVLKVAPALRLAQAVRLASSSSTAAPASSSPRAAAGAVVAPHRVVPATPAPAASAALRFSELKVDAVVKPPGARPADCVAVAVATDETQVSQH